MRDKLDFQLANNQRPKPVALAVQHIERRKLIIALYSIRIFAVYLAHMNIRYFTQ